MGNKGKNITTHNIMETLGVSIVSLLLKEGKVVIPEFGYLELKKFPDKQTVLFKATENAGLFLASEDSIQSHIYNNISIPLREGRVVTLQEIGIFRPMKKADGSYRISYTISSAFRKLLNDAKESENETKNPEVPVPLVKVDEEKIPTSVAESAVEEQKQKEKEKKEVEKSHAEYDAEDNKGKKDPERTMISTPKQDVKEDRKVSRNTSKHGGLVVPQEKKNNLTTRSIITVIAVLIVLIFIVWCFFPDKNKNKRTFVSENDKTQVIGQGKKSNGSCEPLDLPSLAEQKYGNRIFWVYIYKANRDKIFSPVNIPVGTNLRIPNLWEDYKVNVMDSIEIKRAKILSDIMLKIKI
jgi:hypothetical protein